MKGDLEQLFREADVDGNNYLTLQELCAAMRRLGYTGDDSVIKVLLQSILFYFSILCVLYIYTTTEKESTFLVKICLNWTVIGLGCLFFRTTVHFG